MSVWQKPQQLCDLVDQCFKHYRSYRVFKESGFTFWTDAWIAGKYSTLSNVNRVKLCHPKPFPDFVTEVGAIEKYYEATEVLDPSRRRGDEAIEEFRSVAVGGSPVSIDSEENWLTPDKARIGLRKASEKKASKPYSQTSGLVIYLNWPDYFCEETEITSIMTAATEAAGTKYLSLDVLWHDKVFRIWKNGKSILEH